MLASARIGTEYGIPKLRPIVPASIERNGDTGRYMRPVKGRQPILDEKKLSILKKTIHGKTPGQLKIGFASWTTD